MKRRRGGQKKEKEKVEKEGKKKCTYFFLLYIIPMKLHSLQSESDYKQYGNYWKKERHWLKLIKAMVVSFL